MNPPLLEMSENPKIPCTRCRRKFPVDELFRIAGKHVCWPCMTAEEQEETIRGAK
jgi:hypothetical protein